MSKKVLVVLHVYYADQVPYYINKLSNIHDCEWDLVITGNNWPQEAVDQLVAFKSDVRFLQTPNIGYDIWPFIQLIKETDLSKYDLVLKLHTKNRDPYAKVRLNGRYYDGKQWRNLMTRALIGSPEAFGRVLREFDDKKVGIVYAMSVNSLSRGTTVEDSTMLLNELERLGITTDDMNFCAGTMFAVRASALAYLQDPRINVDIFEPTGKSHGSGTNAHVYERILTIAVSAQGYRKVLVPSSWGNWLCISVKNFIQPALEWLFSINHYGDNYDKYLTLFGIRILLSKDDR